jgi:TonB family protein
MRYGVFILAILIVGVPALNQKHRAAPPMPDHFVIARDSFFDFGPPFHYLELIFVRDTKNGSSIERILLTPEGHACVQPAKVEIASASTNKSPAALLGTTNPCAIPEKKLSRELKRRKHGLVFSGVNVVLQVQCGDHLRQIKSDILDRDIYAAAPDTPANTSWTMKLLEQIDQAIGERVVDKPIFSDLEKPNGMQQPNPVPDSPTLSDVSEGKFDAMFPGTTIKPSEVYRPALILPGAPIVRLIGALDVQPEVFSLPVYPAIARTTGTEGEVTFDFDIDQDGIPTDIKNGRGPTMLKSEVVSAIKSWKFPRDSSGRQIKVTFEFILMCKSSDPH